MDSQDGKFPFDTSSIQATLVGNQTNVTTYYYLPDGTLIDNQLHNPFLSTSQTNDNKIEFPKHRFKKFIKDTVLGTIERNEIIIEELDKNLGVDFNLFKL